MRLVGGVILALFISIPALVSAGTYEVCQHYRIEAPRPITFSANEKKLICGDPDAASWEDIPEFQAKYFIKTFLQDRGYFFPTFSEEDGVIIVHPGEQSRIVRVDVEGSPPEFFDVTRRRRIKKSVLTPGILDTLENWTKGQLRENGYPCPNVTSTADAKSGVVKLNIEPGPYQEIIEVIEEPVEGLRPGTLERYRAFRIGDPYDARKLSLTSSIIENMDGILQASYFLTECTPEGAVLTQKSSKGKKRLLRIGLGFSTEDYLLFKILLKWVRIGQNGSSFQILGRGSYRKQLFNTQAFIYPLPWPSRWHLNPIAYSKREDEKRYEFTSISAGMPVAVTFTTRDANFRLRMGPAYEFVRTERGADPGQTHFVSGRVDLDVVSHNYLYYLSDPKTGYIATLSASFNHDAVGSSVTAQRLSLWGESLWNIANFDPSLFVLAVRGLTGTTITDTGSSSFSRLPPNFFYFLGGSASLRGFDRRELPNADRGALTALYAGAEFRVANFFPLNIQPLAFIDFGVLGSKSFDLDFPIYWSPGFGARWPTFVGVFRFTVGHGFMINNKNPANDSLSHWQFYFSFGEEF